MSISSVKTGCARQSIQFKGAQQSKQVDNQNNGKRAAIVAGSTVAGAATGTAVPYFVTRKSMKKTEEAANKQITQAANDLLNNDQKAVSAILCDSENFAVNVIDNGKNKSINVKPNAGVLEQISQNCSHNDLKASASTIEEAFNKVNLSEFAEGPVSLGNKQFQQMCTSLVENESNKKVRNALQYIDDYTLKIVNNGEKKVIKLVPTEEAIQSSKRYYKKDVLLSASELGEALTENLNLDKLKEGSITFTETIIDGAKELSAKGAKAAGNASHIVAGVAGGAMVGLGALALAAFLTRKKTSNAEQQPTQQA